VSFLASAADAEGRSASSLPATFARRPAGGIARFSSFSLVWGFGHEILLSFVWRITTGKKLIFGSHI
jgi:hypothetical protein